MSVMQSTRGTDRSENPSTIRRSCRRFYDYA
jgi:hypothetical protein